MSFADFIKTYRNYIALCSVVSVYFIIYYQALFFEFTNWDDHINITKNADIQSFSWYNLKQIFSSVYVGMYVPITMLSYMCDYALFGRSPFGFHLSSLFWHLLNIFLVWKLTNKITNKNFIVTLITTTIFALHPLQTESVVWLSARSNLMVAFFSMLAILQYWNYKTKYKKKFLYFTFIFFILALFAKPAAITLPVVLWCIDWYLDKKISIGQIKNKIVFLIIAAGFAILTYLLRYHAHHTVSHHALFSLINKFFIVCYAFDYYLIKMLIPSQLTAFANYPIQNTSLLPWYYYITPMLPAAWIFAIMKLKKHQHILLLFLLLYLSQVILIMRIIPIGNQITAMRYAYLPIILFGLAAGYIILQLQEKIKFKKLSLSIIFIAGIFWTCITHAEIKIWKSSYSLYTSMIEKRPAAALPYYNRATVKIDKHNYAGAIEDINAALKYQFEPRSIAYLALANCYKAIEKYNNAFENYDKAIQADSGLLFVYYNRGNLKYSINDTIGAIADFETIIQKDTTFDKAFMELAYIYHDMKEYKKSLLYIEKALLIKPNNEEYALLKAQNLYFLNN